MNLPANVSEQDLKKQYHKLAKIYHPDMHKISSLGSDEKAVQKLHARFRQLQTANETLRVNYHFYV
jgi:DnaJ-class molecular chaperone